MAFKSFGKAFGLLSPLTKLSFPIAALALVFAAQPAPAEPLRIVGFGDSLMAGHQLAPGESFPEKLETVLSARGYDVTVANAGVSGDTTSGGLSRLDWSVPEDTDLVILELGANDMLRGLPPAQTEKNLEEIITRLNARGVRILLLGMYAAPNLGPDYQEAFDTIYPRLAEKHDLPLVPFFLDGVAGDASMQLGDRMHPNAQGVERMVKNVLPAVEALVSGDPSDM